MYLWVHLCFFHMRIYSDGALVGIMGFKWWHSAPLASDGVHQAPEAWLMELIKGGETVTR